MGNYNLSAENDPVVEAFFVGLAVRYARRARASFLPSLERDPWTIHEAVWAVVRFKPEKTFVVDEEVVTASKIVGALDLMSYVWRRWSASNN